MFQAPSFKPKECCAPNCGKSFIPLRSMQQVCSVMCGLRLARAKKAQDKRSLRERKAALKTIPDLLKEAQRVFNHAIRERDRRSDQVCVSCGGVLDWSGNRVDAGHFRSIGSAPHLRFNEHNCHAQCKHCNQYLAGNVLAYRAGLIQRIGLEAVIALESDNQVHKWTREELIAIRDTYKQKLKALKEKA
jgi:hypothetical protein